MMIRRVCLLVCCLLAWWPAAAAETLYITDSIQVMLRSGPAMDRKIIAMLDSGQPLEIIEKGEEWSQIRLPSGRDGWVLTRLIQSEPPLKTRLERLQARYDALLEQSGVPVSEVKRLEDEKAALEKALTQQQRELDERTEAHRRLEAAAGEIPSLKAQNARLVGELARAREAQDGLTRALTAARSKSNLWWFLAGAGVLSLGFLVGLSMRSRRKRSSYY